MNRKQRRAAGMQRRKPGLPPIEMADKLRAARPTEHYRFELYRTDGGKVEGRLVPCAVDWSWLDEVSREGYDPRGHNGPTYYRVSETHYYSVFSRPTGQLVLMINDMQKNAELYDEFLAENPERRESGEQCAERRHHPWLSLTYQISPAIAADLKTQKELDEMIVRVNGFLAHTHEFALSHDLPTDKTIGLVLDDTGNGRKYLLHVIPEEQLVHIDYAPAGFADELRASPNFHHVH